MSITIKFQVPAEVHRALKAKAALSGKTLKKFMSEAAERAAAEPQQATTQEAPHALRTEPEHR